MEFDAERLRVTFAEGARPDGPVSPRRYTLTHSDLTGRLFLTIGAGYDRRALRRLQVLVERDEVRGEWVVIDGRPRLDLHMMAQGGLPVFGSGAMRRRIFRGYRSLVLCALRFGDGALVAAHPELDDARVDACFHWRGDRVERETWGRFGDAR